MKTQNQNPDYKPNPKMMFLEYTTWRKGQHLVSVLIKFPGIEGGWVSARIFREFNPETKKVIYTAKGSDGQTLLPPTENLYQLKKDLKAMTTQFVEQYHEQKQAKIEKDKEVERTDKSKADREQELKEVREQKEDKEKSIER